MKYLLKDDENVYTVAEGQLQPVEYDTITADLFSQYGTDTEPETDLILQLTHPVILCFSDNDFTAEAKISATPRMPQVLTSAWQAFDDTVVGIKNITLTGSDNIKCRFWFEETGDWMIWNVDSSGWQAAGSNDWNTKGEVEVATDYPEQIAGVQLQFLFETQEDYINEAVVYYINVKEE